MECCFFFFFFSPQISLCFMERKKRLGMLLVQRRNQACDNREQWHTETKSMYLRRKADRYFEIDYVLIIKGKKNLQSIIPYIWAKWRHVILFQQRALAKLKSTLIFHRLLHFWWQHLSEESQMFEKEIFRMVVL